MMVYMLCPSCCSPILVAGPLSAGEADLKK